MQCRGWEMGQENEVHTWNQSGAAKPVLKSKLLLLEAEQSRLKLI